MNNTHRTVKNVRGCISVYIGDARQHANGVWALSNLRHDAADHIYEHVWIHIGSIVLRILNSDVKKQIIFDK